MPQILFTKHLAQAKLIKVHTENFSLNNRERKRRSKAYLKCTQPTTLLIN